MLNKFIKLSKRNDLNLNSVSCQILTATPPPSHSRSKSRLSYRSCMSNEVRTDLISGLFVECLCFRINFQLNGDTKWLLTICVPNRNWSKLSCCGLMPVKCLRVQRLCNPFLLESFYFFLTSLMLRSRYTFQITKTRWRSGASDKSLWLDGSRYGSGTGRSTFVFYLCALRACLSNSPGDLMLLSSVVRKSAIDCTLRTLRDKLQVKCNSLCVFEIKIVMVVTKTYKVLNLYRISHYLKNLMEEFAQRLASSQIIEKLVVWYSRDL